MSLAALIKNRHKKGLIIPAIDEHLMLLTGDDRRDQCFHPSDLSGAFCPRAWVLYNYHPDGLETRSASIDPRLQRIFGNGHGVHSRLQSYLHSMGILWGRYINVVTGGVTVGFPPKGPEWVYSEVALSHEPDRIKGHTDGIVNLNEVKWVVEIKSINSHGFKWLQAGAKEMHEEQAMIYMHCLEWMRQEAIASGNVMSDFHEQPLHGCILLYEDKNTQELKEFPILFDEDRIDKMMGKKRKLMRQALVGAQDKVLPDCRCDPKRKSALCKQITRL